MDSSVNILKQIDILSSLTENECCQLYSVMRQLQIGKGEILFSEGDSGDEMYIVVDGCISITVNTSDGDKVEVAVIKGGEFFGEMSILENAPRSATCCAKDQSTLLTFSKEDFFNLIDNYPETAIKILYRMLNTTTSRLQDTGTFLSEMVTWGESARKRAVTDDFTGFYNRRFLDDSLDDCFAKAKLNSTFLSLVMVDLDNFGKLNNEYGEETGDLVLLSVLPVFREVFRESDILARYGGDEFTFILPDTDPETALSLCIKAVAGLREIDILKNKKGLIKKVTSSMGAASFPDHAETVEELKDKTDKALYRAKDEGRDRAVLYTESKKNTKFRIETIAEKNRIVSNIIEAIDENDDFLIIGHKNPDEDCVASMAAFALLLVKFNKSVSIVIKKEFYHNFPYLLNICTYNSIKFIESDNDLVFSTIISVDTPKPSMIEGGGRIKEMLGESKIRKIEIDHHLGTDSEYIGDNGYCLVDEASSACELIGYFAIKLSKKGELLEKYHVSDLFTRNFILSVVTGMISDSKMGKYLKTNREKWFYKYFSTLFNRILLKKTDAGSGNFSTMKDVFAELEKLSEAEDSCYKYFVERKKESSHIAYVVLHKGDMEYLYSEYGSDIIITVARYAADKLAENSGSLSLVVYYDNPEKSNLIQFRMRRNHNYKELDLRTVIEKFRIENGGGHPGAVGFRIKPDEIADLESYTEMLIAGTEEMIEELD